MKINEIEQGFPKTLEIRNTSGGIVWQVYHVNNELEIEMLIATSSSNGFMAQDIVPYDPKREETFPNWRGSKDWRDYWEKYTTDCELRMKLKKEAKNVLNELRRYYQ